MKKLLILSSGVLLPCSLLTGCFTCLSSSCLGEEAYQELMHPKPYLQRWEKPAMTTEGRGQDSADCGGGSSSDHAPSFSQKELKTATRSGEKEHETYSRLHHDWQRCMIKKGYRFTGKCYDNEIGRASPACAGRVLEPVK